MDFIERNGIDKVLLIVNVDSCNVCMSCTQWFSDVAGKVVRYTIHNRVVGGSGNRFKEYCYLEGECLLKTEIFQS